MANKIHELPFFGGQDESVDRVLLPVDRLASAKNCRMTRLGRRVYSAKAVREVDPRGRPYYWIGAGPPTGEEDEESDIAAVHNGWASVTPLHLDLTHHGALRGLASWEGGLNALLKKRTR